MGSGEQSEKDAGIRAVNRDFRKYDQVRKEHRYGLVEDAGRDLFDDEYEIMTCDMSPFFEGSEEGMRHFAESLGEALEGIGFAILAGHGVDPAIYEAGEKLTAEIFEATTAEDRMHFHARRFGSVNQGYFPIKETTNIHPDLVEGWVFCRRAFDLDRDPDYDEGKFWIRPGLEQVFRRIVIEHEKLILPVMQSMLRFLGCDPHLYDRKLTRTNFGFRLNYYPPITEADDASGAGRMLGHEDVDLFTFLPAQSVEGLQVFNRSNGKWIRLNAPPGTIVLNTGDYMQRITNDRFPSTTHRVSKPRDKSLKGKARISMPMAVYVWEDEILEVLPGLGEPNYPPVTALEFHTSTTSKYYGDDYAVKTD